MRITAPLRLRPAAIRVREPHFPLFLLAALLPILLFPFADLDGMPLQRLMLPPAPMPPDWCAPLLIEIKGLAGGRL